MSPASATAAARIPVTAEQEGCASGPAALMTAERAGELAALAKAVSDPVRLRLLAYIAASPDTTACACHLPEALGVSQPTLSHHLKKLGAAGLVTRERRGNWVHYALVPERTRELAGFLDGLPTAAGDACAC